MAFYWQKMIKEEEVKSHLSMLVLLNLVMIHQSGHYLLGK